MTGVENVVFRKLDKSEFDRLKHLFNDSEELWIKYKAMRMREYEGREADTYIAELGGQIVGEITVCYVSHDLPGEAIPNRRVYFTAFRFEPEFRGHGLGQKLMSHAMDDLAGQGITEFTIGVEDDNEAAKHIYFKYGFVEPIARGEGDEFDPTEYTLYLKSAKE